MAVADHSEFGPGYRLSFWLGHTAATRETADNCQIEGWPFAGTPVRFDWPREQTQVEDIKGLLLRAYEAGQHQAKKEIRDVLGIKEPR